MNRQELVFEQPREVLEPRVMVSIGESHEEADIVAVPAPLLRRDASEEPFGSIEDELPASHADTSQIAAWAW